MEPGRGDLARVQACASMRVTRRDATGPRLQCSSPCLPSQPVRRSPDLRHGLAGELDRDRLQRAPALAFTRSIIVAGGAMEASVAMPNAPTSTESARPQ
jgi:hypothetical protein